MYFFITFLIFIIAYYYQTIVYSPQLYLFDFACSMEEMGTARKSPPLSANLTRLY